MEQTLALPLYDFNFKFLSWKWLQIWSIIVLLSLCLILSGCTFASFVAAAEKDIPVVIEMVTNVTDIIAPGISVAIGAAGGLALASLAILCGNPAPGASKCDSTSLIGQYQAATDPTIKTTLLQKIQAALVAVNAHINEMLSIAQGLPTSIAGAIVIAVGVILETVTLLISLIPQLGKLKSGVLKLTKAQFPQQPKQLKARFNAAVSFQWPTAVVY